MIAITFLELLYFHLFMVLSFFFLSTDVPILGLLQTESNSLADSVDKSQNLGRLVVYGDSNCLDNSHLQKDCFWMLDALLEYTTTGHLAGVFSSSAGAPIPPTTDLPTKMENSNLHKHSKVCIFLLFIFSG